MIVSYLMPSFERPAPSLHQEATELLRFLVTPHPILQSFQNLPVMVSRFPRLAGLFTGSWFVCTVLSLWGGAFAVVHLRAGDRYIIWPILQTNQHSYTITDSTVSAITDSSLVFMWFLNNTMSYNYLSYNLGNINNFYILHLD